MLYVSVFYKWRNYFAMWVLVFIWYFRWYQKSVVGGAWKKDKKRHDKTVRLPADVEIKCYVPYDLVILGAVSRMASQIFQDFSRKIAVFFEETNTRKRRKFMIQIWNIGFLQRYQKICTNKEKMENKVYHSPDIIYHI